MCQSPSEPTGSCFVVWMTAANRTRPASPWHSVRRCATPPPHPVHARCVYQLLTSRWFQRHLLCFLPSSRDLGCKHASLQLSSLSMCFTAYLEACTIRVWHWEALASPPFSMLAQHAGRSRRPWQRPPWINSTLTSWHTMWEITTGMGAKNSSKAGFLEQIQSQGLEKDSSMHFFCSKYHANVSLNGIHQ